MANEKFKNLFLILIITLILIGIPYLLYTMGTFIEINYFGYLNNWWIVLLFILVLFSVFILGGIDLEKNIAYFFLLFFTFPFFILGIKFGVKHALDWDSYELLFDKEQEIDRLDSIVLKLENDFAQLEIKSIEEQTLQGATFKNHEIIFFNPGSSKLSDFNKLKITAFVSSIKKCNLNINGFTDGSGNKTSNMDISNKRAQNVADFIKSINQQGNTINSITGFGDDHHLVENRNEKSRSKNRRVTIEIVGTIDTEAIALRKNILEEINEYREDIKKVKLERDSLRKVIYPNIEG